MILGAGLLLLLGLGLFVAGLATGVTGLYWGCVGVCVVAAVLLFAARRRLSASQAGSRVATPKEAGGPATAGPAPATATAPAGTAAAGPPATTAPGEQPATASSTSPAEPGAAHATAGGDGLATHAVRAGGSAGATAAHADHAAVPPPAGGGHAAEDLEEPPMEDVEVTDLLLVVDLRDEVLVVDEHPRYHLPGCPRIAGRATIPLPLDEAKTDGFTPCGVCTPDRVLADQVRARKAPREN